MKLYHGTPNQRFQAFRGDRPTYFFIDPAEAKAIVRLVGGRVLSIELDEQPIDERTALAIWNDVNPHEAGDTYLYSMLCFETNEFPLVDIHRFIDRLMSRGIVAITHRDYSQVDMQNDATAVCVFNASGLRFVSREVER